ncbi:T5orf172 domain-containing protein [Paraburkholderia phenazinium]|uniref:T5orf172 domain-containing protein n=1 Tax=Paraburkholderia phenazinium TaxID=60549 RepID=A0A1G7Y6L6_9BURK|nr:GIY-YIG nuclease family protein [Paraburkholderia phenazinium]SDG91630.1 T5orf172 domain-containing protein [Paraburkholderia phenazinium]
MEGYVYVMSNQAMPGLVKVGFTTGTPDERAAQLKSTGVPHRPTVEFYVQVPDARAVEREAHLRLRQHKEAKEWFRCSREVAIAAVKRSAGVVQKNEFSRPAQEKLREAELSAYRDKAEAQRQAKVEEERKAALRVEVENKHYRTIQQLGDAPGYLAFWAGTSAVACVGLAIGTHLSDAGIVLGGIVLAALPAVILKEWADGRKRKAKPYLDAVARRQADLDAIDRTPPPRSTPKPSASAPSSPGGVSAAVAPKAGASVRATAPAAPPARLIHGDYTVDQPTMPIAQDKSPEQRARERAARKANDPSG